MLPPASGSVAPTTDPGLGSAHLIVTDPLHSGESITTRRLRVTGYALGTAAIVRVSLQARREREIETATIRPRQAADGAAVEPVGRFSVAFDLPNPRPNGTMVLEVALIADDGRVVDTIRRRVVLDAIVPTTPGSAGAPSFGEDGLMGGLPFGTLSDP